jgi:hypothetical protein
MQSVSESAGEFVSESVSVQLVNEVSELVIHFSVSFRAVQGRREKSEHSILTGSDAVE